MASPYQKLELKQFPAVAARQTAENQFWKSFRFPIITKNLGPVSCIHFSEKESPDFAVTAGSRVLLYNTNTNQIKKKITRFRDAAYSGVLRPDGKVLLAGGEHPTIQLFELATRTVLRTLRGHTGPVRVTKFAPSLTSIISSSDDKTIRTWDIASGSTTAILNEHTDYVRCIATTKSMNHMWCSASYDHTVKIWDSRLLGTESDTQQSIMSLNHGDPIEALLMFPNGGTVISAGSNQIKVWDLLAGGRLVHTFSNHQKTITTMFFNDDHSRLFSGSLDRNLKVYDVKTYNVVHSTTYPSPILSAGLSHNKSHLVVGMTDGLLSIRHRATKKESTTAIPMTPPKPGTLRYYNRGSSFKGHEGDIRVDSKKNKKMGAVNTHLRKHEFRHSVQAAVESRDIMVFYSLLMELMQRNVLKTALSGRNADELLPLLSLIRKHLTNPKYTFCLIHTINVLLDIYGSVLSQSPEVDELLLRISAQVKKELRLQEKMAALLGSVDFVINASNLSAQIQTSENTQEQKEVSVQSPPKIQILK